MGAVQRGTGAGGDWTKNGEQVIVSFEGLSVVGVNLRSLQSTDSLDPWFARCIPPANDFTLEHCLGKVLRIIWLQAHSKVWTGGILRFLFCRYFILPVG